MTPLAKNAAQARASAERLGCTVDIAMLLDEIHPFDVTANRLATLNKRAEAYGCRVETLLVIDALKSIDRSFAKLDGDE